jgi:hypothetical protein
MQRDLSAGDISRLLASRIDSLARDLLPAGKREGAEWRVGSIAGESGHSLGVHLTGTKAGVWSDFSAGTAGDALDLVRAVLGADLPEALRWSRFWLGVENGTAELPARPAPVPVPKPELDIPDRWRGPWNKAVPIAGTRAATYLAARGLCFEDPEGAVLRFASRRVRLNPDDQLEHHPALLALLRDVRTCEPTGLINIYLRPDGGDRLRDKKGKTNTGRAANAAVMLSPFDEPTYGLTTCEGAETGIALVMAQLAPVWACGGAGVLSSFPVLGGIEALTVAADADPVGQRAAAAVVERWRNAGRIAVTIAPPSGDWADLRRTAA